MTARQLPAGAAVHGGHDGASQASQASPAALSVASRGSAAVTTLGGVAADPMDRWPAWARPQLLAAHEIAAGAPDRGALARLLYREWFCAAVAELHEWRTQRPPLGVYRFAHAGTARRVSAGGVITLARNDVLGRDGWWRTWGRRWTPPRSRPGSVRVLCTPAPLLLGDFVAAVTGALLDSDVPWSLTCATDPRRLRRTGAAVLDVPDVAALPAGLLAALAPMMLPAAPPLCLPLHPGMAVAGYPDNGMTFGEHRCHLISLSLRAGPACANDALTTMAQTFDTHGIDPAQPYR